MAIVKNGRVKSYFVGSGLWILFLNLGFNGWLKFLNKIKILKKTKDGISQSNDLLWRDLLWTFEPFYAPHRGEVHQAKWFTKAVD